jgi:hypothetical protein
MLDLANAARTAGKSVGTGAATSELIQQQAMGSNRDMAEASGAMNDSATLGASAMHASGSAASEAASDRGVARRLQDGVIAERKAIADSTSKAFG